MSCKIKILEHQFQSARTSDELNRILQNCLTSYGITTFSFTYYSYHLNALNKLKYDFASPNYLIWHQHYLEEHYEEVDTTLGSGSRITIPTFWNVEEQLKNATTQRERQMRLDSVKFGAIQGISIPIHGPRGDFANFVLVQMRGETCLDDWQSIQYELFLVGYCYYSYLQRHLSEKLQQDSIKKYKINQRDMQYLTLLARHFSDEEIAEELQVTIHTVHYHIKRLNKKLGTKNKHQSVVVALENALII